MGRRRGNRILRAFVKDDTLTIEIGVKTLAFAAEHGPLADVVDPECTDDKVKVTDPQRFAETIAGTLMSEQGEDGSTFLTKMLDEAIGESVEWGNEYITLPGDDRD